MTAVLTAKVKIFRPHSWCPWVLLGYQLGVIDRKTIRNIQKAVSRSPSLKDFSENRMLPNSSLGIHVSADPIFLR